MTDQEIAHFIEREREHYTGSLMAAGEPPDYAKQHAAEEWSIFFPDGHPAPGHRLYQVEEAGSPIGLLWLGPPRSGRTDETWIYYIEINPTHRGQGHGRATMALAEQNAREHGSTRLRLTVLGANTVARHLYESQGFEPVTLSMLKHLD